MPHHRLGSKITVYSPFQFPVGLCLPLVLAQMFCPGIHQEYFQIAIRNFTIPKDPPPIGAITTSHATVLMHCFYKFCCLLRNDSVFDCNENWSLLEIGSNFLDNDGHAPVVPRTQIGRRIGEFREKRDRYIRDSSDSSVDQRRSNRCSLCERTPNHGPESVTSLINQDEDSEDSCSYPIRRQVLDESVNERNEDDPHCAADQHDRSECAQRV